MQMLQRRDQITILYTTTTKFRHVRMNQPHPAQVETVLVWKSVGHYDGERW